MSDLKSVLGGVSKKIYVGAIRLARPMFRYSGILAYLEKRPSRRAKWFRSLFAIYDLDDLVSLNLPWWSFDAVDYVEDFLNNRSAARVFEWGSGASTIWLSRLADEVISIEHDLEFAGLVNEKIGDNDRISVRAVPPSAQGTVTSLKPGFEGLYFDDYVSQIDDTEGQFDIIVIDGRAREACLSRIGVKLKPDGIIVFDDTERRRYSTEIRRSSYLARRMAGLSVCLPIPKETTILRPPAGRAEE